MKTNWINLFITQFLGVLNDNLLKNLICFVAIYWSAPEDKSLIIAAASATMVLPFILLSPLAGYFAQRYTKTLVIKIAKLAEIFIMLLACVGFYSNSLLVVLLCMLLMGIHSSLLSPAKYGLVNELSESGKVSLKLGIMELLSFVAVLLASTIAGFLADNAHNKNLIITIVLLSISAVSFFVSLKIKTSNQPESSKAERVLNPIKYFIQSYKGAKKYKGVNAAVLGLAVFWFIGALLQMNLLVHCTEVLHMSNSSTGLITAFVAVGIGVGCYVAGLISKKRLEMGLIFFGVLVMAICLFVLAKTGISTSAFIVVLMLTAFFGGIYKIPLNTWVQERTEKTEISKMLAYSNMMIFLAILLASVSFALLQSVFTSGEIFEITGWIALLTALIVLVKIPFAVLRWMLVVTTKVLYRLKFEGNENLPVQSGGIIACNHVSMLDFLLIIATAPRNVRFVMHEKFYNIKFLKPLLKKCNMIPISAGKDKDSLRAFTNRCKTEINNGHLICIFPEGMLSRNGQMMPFKKGIEHISKATNAPIYPMHIDNVVGTPLSYKIGTAKQYGFGLKNLRKKVFISLGKAISSPVSAFELRQAIKELEVNNFSRRTKELNAIEAANVAAQQVHRKGDVFQKIEDLELKDVVINTPNYTIKDLMGNDFDFIGTREDAAGKPLPGVTVTILDEQKKAVPANTCGQVFFKHAFTQSKEWLETEYYGFMDECGFLVFT
ncbi:MAG: MFS transporter [Bacteroidetes bacterium]|nr:MFS transporter [Bacteroidota bacterium]